MKRTPDNVSKKRQELSHNLMIWQKTIEQLSLYVPMTYTDSIETKQKLEYAYEQVKICKQELKNTQKYGRRLSLDFNKPLHPGVY